MTFKTDHLVSIFTMRYSQFLPKFTNRNGVHSIIYEVHSIIYLNLLTETEEKSVHSHCIDAEETGTDKEGSNDDQLESKSVNIQVSNRSIVR